MGDLGWRWLSCLALLLSSSGVAIAVPESQDAASPAAVALPVAGATAGFESPPAAEPSPLAQPQTLSAGHNDYRGELERAWFSSGSSLGVRASAARKLAIELGATNAETAARALVAPASRRSGLGEALLAVRLAPDLPLAHAELARVHWSNGERSAALSEVLAAVAAIPRNLEATLWLLSTLFVIASVVMAGASLVFVALAGLSVFPRAAHDLGDIVSSRMPAFARAGLLGGILIAPALFGEGIAGLALSCFALAVAYGSPRLRAAAALACVVFVLSVFPVARMAGRVLGTLSADPVAAATHAVIQDLATDVELELLRSVERGDTLAALALAVNARRAGDTEGAFLRYSRLREREPLDAVVMTNLANLHFRRGDVDEAIDLYEQASERIESPALWFNLSQAYARAFRMEDFEQALRTAQTLGASVVNEMSAQEDPSLIADLPIPVSVVRARMVGAARGEAFAASLRAPLMPGRLGRGWAVLAAAFTLVGVGSLFLAGRFDHASACGRCGVRICARCDGTVWNAVTCENCHQLFNHPESTDATLRIARLGQLRARELRIDRIARLGALLVPGVGGMAARRPDLAFMAILFFGWAVLAYAWRSGVVPDPLVVGSAGPIVLVASAAAAGLAYTVVVIVGIVQRRNLA